MSVITITALTGLYAAVGGLTAVVMTESVGTIVLLAGSLLITVFGIIRCGGLGEAWRLIGEAGQHFPAATTSVLRPAGDPSGMPWFAMMLGYPVISIWYWCADQTIVQRVLGAKSENDARNGALFAGLHQNPARLCLRAAGPHLPWPHLPESRRRRPTRCMRP